MRVLREFFSIYDEYAFAIKVLALLAVGIFGTGLLGVLVFAVFYGIPAEVFFEANIPNTHWNASYAVGCFLFGLPTVKIILKQFALELLGLDQDEEKLES
jgi:hypothetical protein|tara:strand:- start:14 stop:313 length:300 start_codon:yes stop_codon:yes gene_type:complete